MSSHLSLTSRLPLGPVRFGAATEADSLESYLTRTGFSDTQETSRRIEAHAIQKLNEAAQSVGVEILYSGYNKSCSVGRGEALPGSDLDHWIILYRGNDAQKQALVRALYDKLDPELMGKESVSPALFISEAEARQHADYRIADLYNVATFNASAQRVGNFMEIFREGKTLLNRLDGETKRQFENSVLYRECRLIDQTFMIEQAPKKAKTIYRENLIRLFPTLSSAEKTVIMKILKAEIQEPRFSMLASADRDLMQRLTGVQTLEPVPMRFLYNFPQNPEQAVLQSLAQKQLLILSPTNSMVYMVPWKPTHEEEKWLTQTFFPEIKAFWDARRNSQ